MSRNTGKVFRLIAVLGALTFVLGACNVEDSGNTYGGGDAGGGNVEQSGDPNDVPDDMLAVSGRVVDRDTLTPIQGAIISTEPPIGQIMTNGQGQYVFTAGEFPDLQPEKLYRITATHPDYVQDSVQLMIQPGHNRNADIALAKAAATFEIELSQTNVDFSDTDFRTSNIASERITMRLTGATAETVDFSAAVPPGDADWLSVEPATGTISETPVFLDITVDRTDLPTGTYNGRVDITAPGGSATVNVTLVVGEPAESPDAE